MADPQGDLVGAPDEGVGIYLKTVQLTVPQPVQNATSAPPEPLVGAHSTRE